nr:PREDICTED: M-phase phosphoprotein 9 isoform X1 [Latimeria chalumnae]|eukprot:XP_014339732.1 PREDICTED: M-phase phosphoprotein 9 isoform X1 [Latimeria chalumnae]
MCRDFIVLRILPQKVTYTNEHVKLRMSSEHVASGGWPDPVTQSHVDDAVPNIKDGDISVLSTDDQTIQLGTAMEGSDSDSLRTVKEITQSSEFVDFRGVPLLIEQISNVNGTTAVLHANGVPTLAGTSLPCVNLSSVETLSTLMEEIQNSGETDPEIWRNSEGRWLQLFQLMERQYQEQILAQQEQYQSQIQIIQDEIKALVQLQKKFITAHSPLSFTKAACNSTPSAVLNEHDSRSQNLEEDFKQTDLKPPGLQQESSVDSSLMSSGYYTLSTCESTFNKLTSPDQVGDNVPHLKMKISRDHDAKHAQVENDLCSSKISDECRGTMQLSNKDHTLLKPDDSERKERSLVHRRINNISVEDIQFGNQCNEQKETNGKPLTSWAQKPRQKKQKGKITQNTQLEEESARRYAEGTEPATDTASPGELCSAAASSSQPFSFYLSRSNDSPNSLVSNASGLTYWKLDEKEMYHSLPQNLEHGCPNLFSPDALINQTSTDGNWQPPSLKDIFYMKKQDNLNLADSKLISQLHLNQASPEVLTLDPTLHMKPSQQHPRFPLYHSSTSMFNPETLYTPHTGNPVSPDSILGPTSQTPSDTGSHASYVLEPHLNGSQKSPSHNISGVKTWSSFPSSEKSFLAPNQPPVTFSETRNDDSSHTEEEESNSPLTLSSISQSRILSRFGGLPDHSMPVSSLGDPTVLSKIRQSLKEKHARHVADLRAYYEGEISNLKQQLETASTPTESVDMKKAIQNLKERCEQLEGTAAQANRCIRDLENKNRLLQKQLNEWPERFDAVRTTTQILQQRLDEMRSSNKEKDNTISKLKSRITELEEAFENAYKWSDDKEARMKQEHKMLQDLLTEYESLGKEHERVKDTLNDTENKLFDANTQISELKRLISKLEVQLKQLEHENTVKLRLAADGHSWSFGSGFFHHPEVFQSPSKKPADEVSKRKCLTPGAEHSIFTGLPLDNKNDMVENTVEETYLSSRRYHSPPEKDPPLGERISSKVALKKELETTITPIMKALKEFELNTTRSQGMQTDVQEFSDTEGTSPVFLNRRQTVAFVDATSNRNSTTKCKDQQRSKRYNNSNAYRSSSLPPSNRKSSPISTPTKRETMLTPISMKSSPKRCPKENLSPGISQLLGKEENTVTRFDARYDDLEYAPVCSRRSCSPRKKLQFVSLENTEVESEHSSNSTDANTPFDSCTERALNAVKTGCVTTRSAWEGKMTFLQNEKPRTSKLSTQHETELASKTRMETLAETERLFDELTLEKQQIEAALSRMPGTGGRMTLQARLDKEALEDRLEKVNRDLGSIRMTLKRFHILWTSAHL